MERKPIKKTHPGFVYLEPVDETVVAGSHRRLSPNCERIVTDGGSLPGSRVARNGHFDYSHNLHKILKIDKTNLTNMTNNGQKLNSYNGNKILRLRGGDLDSSTDDEDIEIFMQKLQSAKRRRSNTVTPPKGNEGLSLGGEKVDKCLDNIDCKMGEMKTHLDNMMENTKISKAWRKGIDAYLQEISIEIRRVSECVAENLGRLDENRRTVEKLLKDNRKLMA